MMFFSTVPGLNFDMCMISTRIKTIYPLDTIVEYPAISGMANFRSCLETAGLPEEVCQVIMASWQGSAQQRYEDHGKYGRVGVFNGRSVHFQPL